MAHISYEELGAALERAATEVVIGARYYHYKDPEKHYTVTGFTVIEADDTVGVLYSITTGPHAEVTFMRPLVSFLGTVEVEGRAVPRFTKVVE